MTLRLPLTLGLVALALAAPVAAQAQAPNPNNPYIVSLTYGGTGCPQGSLGQSFANDRLSFTVIFDQFVASQGPGVPAANKRRSCEIKLNLYIPPGSGASCVTFDHRGYVQLPSGGSAQQDAKYDFKSKGYGPTRIGKGDSTFTGPVSKDYLSRDSSTFHWSASADSNEPLTIGASLLLTGNGQAQLTTDSIDGKIELGACEPPPNH